MVEAIKVDTTVDRIRSKSKEDRTFALKLDNHFCPMTIMLQGKPDYPLLRQKYYSVDIQQSCLILNKRTVL